MADIHTLVGKAVTDPEFCRRLVSDPEGTLKASGVSATPEMLGALRSIDAGAVQKLAAAFQKDQVAS